MAWYDIAPDYSIKAAAGEFLGEFVNQVKDNYSPKAIAKEVSGEVAKSYAAAGGTITVDTGSAVVPVAIIGGLAVLAFLTIKRK